MPMENQARKRPFKQHQGHGPGAVHGSLKSKVTLDANSERNAAFYRQDEFTNVYPKLQVYPVEGGEIQLEQLKARLPRYCPPPSPMLKNELRCDDMEMTMPCVTNITILPGMNNKENASVVGKHPKHPSNTRQPLQAVVRIPMTSSSLTLSPDEELDRLCQEKEELREPHVNMGGKGREDSAEAISELLDDMVLQQSLEREKERQNKKPVSQACPVQYGSGAVPMQVSKVNALGVTENEDTSHLVNQENKVYLPCLPQLPALASRNRSCATRLNFSDAESSLGTSQPACSQLSSLMEDSVGGRGSLLGHSQVHAQEQYGAGGQSFEVFHDSWRDQSHNTSHGRPSAQQPGKQQPAARYLQELTRTVADVSSFAEPHQSYDQSHSFQAGASKSNMSSFSVYEGSVEQSSLVPFHDSWANLSKDGRPSSAEHSTGMPTTGDAGRVVGPVPPEQEQKREGDVVYHAALGVPLEGDGMAAGNISVVDQSFTQVGIYHPKHTPNISTPVSKKMDFTFDMSRIQPDVEIIPSSSCPPDHPQHPSSGLPSTTQRKRSVVSAAINLSTIKEESSSLKSSRSSACTTATSSSSSCSQSSHESLGSHVSGDMDVNPFSPEIVNMMLNALCPGSIDNVCSVPTALPQLLSGRTVVLSGHDFPNLKNITSGGFGTIYTCRHGEETKVLKVQKPALKWEIAIISELHTRLHSSNLAYGSQCFVRTEQSFVFDNASVMVLPHYKHGSLLDLSNAHGAHLYESFLFYYTAELLEIVASLHHCGILHTDIKPDNFMLADISLHKNFASAHGRGLVLIDFGRAVDLVAFPGDIMFRGSCETEGFQCTQMLEGKPWKYEVDYFGIAATVHVLLTGQYMSIVRDAQTNIYRLQKPLRRSQHQSLWNEFFSCLLNTTQPLHLPELAAERRAKIDGIKNYVFQAFIKKIVIAVKKQLS